MKITAAEFISSYADVANASGSSLSSFLRAPNVGVVAYQHAPNSNGQDFVTRQT
jgi:hypothetical protein